MRARYAHDDRVVEAMRFVGNGPDVAAWLGAFGRAEGCGLAGTLRVAGREVESGDWVVLDGLPRVVSQCRFPVEYQRVGDHG